MVKFPQNIFPLLIAYQIRIANNGAILFYSGNPGVGNLVGALSPKSGTDAFGNVYPQGYSLLMGGQQIVMGILAGNPLIYWVTGNSHIKNSGAIQAFQQSSGAGAWDLFQVIGPQSTTNDDMGLIVFSSSSDDGVTSKANLTLQYRDQALNFHAYERVDYAGISIVAGSIAAVTPGTGLSSSNVATGEVWHTATLGSGWGNASGFLPVEYRKTADGMIEIQGVASTTNATPAGPIFTLPVGWAPSVRVRTPGVIEQGTPNIAIYCDIGTGGGVNLTPAPAATGLNFYFSVRLPV
jgi:hypothetical protein